MRRLLGLVLVVLAVAVYLRAPVGEPVEAPVGSPPAGTKWVRLTGGRLDVLEGAFVRSQAGEITDLLVPLRPEAAQPETEVRVVVRVAQGDPLFEMLRQGDRVSEADAGAFLQQYRQAMVPKRPVQGVVVNPSERDLARLKALQPKLAAGWILVEEGATPGRPAAWAWAAALLGLLGVAAIGSPRPAG